MTALTLTVEANTAIRDNFSLYDFDSSYYNHQNFTLKNPTTLFLSHNKVKPFEALPKSQHEVAVPLLKVQKQNSTKEPVLVLSAEEEQNIWLIVSRLPKINGIKGIKISRGDTFKIGKSKIYVKDIQEPSKVKFEDIMTIHDLKSISKLSK